MSKQTFTTGQVLTAAQVNSLQANDYNQTVSVKTASYTLAAADKGTRIEFNTSGSVTCTVNSGLFDAGDTLVIQNRGAGAATVTAGTATVNTSASLVVKQYDSGVLYFVSDSSAIYFASDAADTPLTTKGDLFTFSTAADRLAVGANGTYLQADSTTSTGLKWGAVSAGVNKNYLINGGFAISQRATSFTSTGGANNDDTYTLDRWYILSDTNDVIDVTQDTTTVPTNGQFAIALDVETVNKKFGIATIIENKDCVGLIGNTVTFSFKAKVSSTTKLDNVKAAIVAWSGTADTVTSDIISAWNVEGTNPTLIANATYENTPANLNLTTSYATYSVSAAVDTASTKNLILFVWSDVTDTTLGDFLYIAEAKLELGSSATAFEYAGGTIAGELEACQRYYILLASGMQKVITNASYISANAIIGALQLPTTMRVAPTLSVVTGTSYWIMYNTGDAFDSLALIGFGYDTSRAIGLYGSANVAGTSYDAAMLTTNNAAAFLAVQAEL